MPQQNIIIQAGATFDRSISLTDINGNALDVTGYTANAAMRREPSSNTFTLFETNLTLGNLELRMEANTTATLEPGYYVYDAIISNNTNVYRVIEGIVQVTPGVTTGNPNPIGYM